MPALRVATWNVQWARPPARRGRAVKRRLERLDADIIVVTEGFATTLPDGGHWIAADADYGYGVSDRRKVLLWSRSPWRDVDTLGHESMPSGRFVAGTTETHGVTLRVVGVCIPWRDAHVRSGRCDRRAWEDHLAFLTGLSTVLESMPRSGILVAGDFNQRVPPYLVPRRCAEQLGVALGSLLLATGGNVPPLGRRLIDHVAHSRTLVASSVTSFPRDGENGERMSDHDGVVVELGSST